MFAMTNIAVTYEGSMSEADDLEKLITQIIGTQYVARNNWKLDLGTQFYGKFYNLMDAKGNTVLRFVEQENKKEEVSNGYGVAIFSAQYEQFCELLDELMTVKDNVLIKSEVEKLRAAKELYSLRGMWP